MSATHALHTISSKINLAEKGAPNGVPVLDSNGDVPTTQLNITKSDVGLANVDNTSDANKPVSTATQTALNAKAPLDSPALTGTPTAPTAAVNTNTTQVATTAFVNTEISNDAAPKSHAANASTYGYGDSTNAGHLRVGNGLTVTTGTVAANINDNGTATNELYSAELIDRLITNLATAFGKAGVQAPWSIPSMSPILPAAGVGSSISGDASSLVISRAASPYANFYKKGTYDSYYATNAPSLSSLLTGQYVCLSDNGSRLIVKNANNSAASHFEWSAGSNTYVLVATLTPPSSDYIPALSGDGLYLLFWVTTELVTYKWDGSAWVLTNSPDISPATGSGYNLDVSANGAKSVLNAGAAMYTYAWNQTNNRYQKTADPLTSTTISGISSIKMSSDGSRLVVAISTAPYLITYLWNGTNNRYEETALPDVAPPGQVFGTRFLALSGDGTTVVYYCNTNNVFIYRWNSGTSRYEKFVFAYSTAFGNSTSISLSDDGKVLSIGVPNSPYHILYEWSSSSNQFWPMSKINKIRLYDGLI